MVRRSGGRHGGARVDTSVLKRLRRMSPVHVGVLLLGAATEMVADIKLSFNTGPDGRGYRRGNVVHIASSPGNPPNSDTGTLRASITFTPETVNLIYIHDQTDYGIHLERGTEFIDPRPFMTPVFEAWRQRRFNEYIKTQGLIPWR